ncbi:MAG: uracil-DNA glycosylase [Dehalococcoidia bacterium]|nr:uracil-DNA glycosylase [Dehalococcoidia bacterium]
MSELLELEGRIRACTDCTLSRTRTNAVPGEGPENPRLVFIGEGPGFYEDHEGRPFVGAAGRLLEQLLAGIGLTRDQVFITNVVKCRPPENRDPLPGEVQACRKYLEHQLRLLRPQVVATLGRFSLGHFFPQETIGRVHGRPRQTGDVTIYPLYHPAAALRSSTVRKALEDDMKRLPAVLKESGLAQAGMQPQVTSAESTTQQLKLL